MKVVFLVHSLRKGGAERLVLELASSQKELNSHITIISWLDTMEYLEEQYREIEYKSLLHEEEYRWLRSINSSSIKLKKILNDISPDAIFIFSHSVLWLSLLSGYKTSYINVIQGFNQISKFKKFKKIFYRPIDIISSKLLNFKVITPTKALAEEISRYFLIDPKNIKIISNGIEMANDYMIPNHKKTFTVSMLGTLGRQKGQHLAIDAIVKLIQKYPRMKLNIIGEGILKDYLAEKIRALDLGHNVHLLGRVDDAFEIMQKSDIFWHLSVTEGMPLAIIEAMALGLPIIGFDVEGVRDVVSDNRNGYLVKYGDIDGIVEKTSLLLDSDDTRKIMSSQSQKLYNSKYTKKLMLKGYRACLENLL